MEPSAYFSPASYTDLGLESFLIEMVRAQILDCRDTFPEQTAKTSFCLTFGIPSVYYKSVNAFWRRLYG